MCKGGVNKLNLTSQGYLLLFSEPFHLSYQVQPLCHLYQNYTKISGQGKDQISHIFSLSLCCCGIQITDLQQLFKDKDWTDYNPIILPTEERVTAMLKGTSQPNE